MFLKHIPNLKKKKKKFRDFKNFTSSEHNFEIFGMEM